MVHRRLRDVEWMAPMMREMKSWIIRMSSAMEEMTCDSDMDYLRCFAVSPSCWFLQIAPGAIAIPAQEGRGRRGGDRSPTACAASRDSPPRRRRVTG